jgi:hypothetical protein
VPLDTKGKTMKELLTKKYGNVVEGPQGLRMPETTARAVEAAMKGLPKDFTFRRVGKSADTTPDPDSRTDISIITTDARDRDDEVLLPAGGDWAEFKKNPIVTFDHNYDELPAGSCLWMKCKANSIIAKTMYPTKPEDWGDSPWLPSAVLHLMQQDPPILTGKSVGFIPKSVRTATSEEKSLRPEWKGAPIIDQWIGLEYAVATMPCNPEATMITVAKSADVDDHVVELVTKSFNTVLGKLKKKSMANLPDVSEDAIKEAALMLADRVPYLLLDEYRYALMRRFELTDEHRETIQFAIIDTFDRALGLVE